MDAGVRLTGPAVHQPVFVSRQLHRETVREYATMSGHPGSSGSNRPFATTSRSMVVEAGGCGSESRQALEQLCQLYWYPLYAFLRRKQHSRQAAEDIAQGFLVHLLEQGLIRMADRQRGRFGTW